VTLTVVALLVMGAGAAAAPVVASVGPVVQVSAPGFACPLSTVDFSSGGANYPSAEVEPWVAANPSDPGNLVAVFQQDRWSTVGPVGLAAVLDQARHTDEIAPVASIGLVEPGGLGICLGLGAKCLGDVNVVLAAGPAEENTDHHEDVGKSWCGWTQAIPRGR
jgi:hypothetical protein